MSNEQVPSKEDVLNKAKKVFGVKAEVWLSRENRALGGVTPDSLLMNKEYRQKVMDVLGRIEFGVIS